jgi:hypothetical protein
MNSRPKRIQLSRKKGWRMPPNTVKVDRTTRWGNPFRVDESQDAAKCVRLYRLWMGDPGSVGWQEIVPLARRDLRGKNLACWCPLGAPCHADVLLEIANA